MSASRNCLIVFLITTLWIVAGPAAAQQASESLDEIEEIIVTASRRGEKLQDTAISVTVLDTNRFAQAGKFSLPELLPFVPGVTVQDGGASFSNGVIIRGINAFGSGGIATYIDDIPYGSSVIYSSGGAPIDGVLLDLESLNVLKGPQGTLYGASAMGGLLKFKTRSASLDSWSGSVSADLSDTSGGGLNQLYRVSANGPLTDNLGLSVTAFNNDKTGYIDNVTIPRDSWDDYDYYGGSASMLWVPADDWRVKFQALYQKSTQEGLATIQTQGLDDFPIPGIPQRQPSFGGRYQTGEPDINPSIYETTVYGLTVEKEFGFGTLTSVTSYQELQFTQTADLTIPFAGIADLFFPGNAPHTSALFVGDLGWDKKSQEIRLTSNDNENFEWLVGAFYQDEEGFNIQDLILTPPEPLLFFANFPSGYEETNIFGTGTYYVTPEFDVSLGVRYSDFSQSVVLETRDSILVAPLPFNEVDGDVTTYLLNFRYRPSDTMSWYGRIASGFRPGGANFVLVDPVTGEQLTEPRFDSDDLVSYELGLKGRNGRLSYDVAAYFIDWQDYLIQVVRGGLSVGGNAKEASSRGAEAAISFAATDSLQLSATLSYIDAQLDTDEPDLGARSGEQIPGAPEWQGTVSFNWNFNVADWPAYLSGSLRYSGDYSVGYPGYTGSSGTFFPSSAPRVNLPSYTVFDISAGVTNDNYDVSLYVTNLLDDDDFANFASSFSSFSIATPLRPRTFGVVLKYKF